MKAAEMGRSRWGGRNWPGTVGLIEDRASTVRILTAVCHLGPAGTRVRRAFDAIGGLQAVESLLDTAPVPDLIVVDGPTCGEMAADVLLALAAGRDQGRTAVMLLTGSGSPPAPELLAMADLWGVKVGEIEAVPDVIRLLHAASRAGASPGRVGADRAA